MIKMTESGLYSLFKALLWLVLIGGIAIGLAIAGLGWLLAVLL